MNKYWVQYRLDGNWVPLMIQSDSIYEATDWVRENIQPTGICVSLLDQT